MSNIKEIVEWYVQVNEVKYKVEKIYMEYLPVRYGTDAYLELLNIHKCAYKQLKEVIKK